MDKRPVGTPKEIWIKAVEKDSEKILEMEKEKQWIDKGGDIFRKPRPYIGLLNHRRRRTMTALVGVTV